MAHSTVADQGVWEELTDEQRAAIRRLVADGLGPYVECSECLDRESDGQFGGVSS